MATSTEQEAPAIDFVEAPLGLMGLRRFQLDALDESGLLFALRSTEADGVRLFVVPPQPYFPRYSPALDLDAIAGLGLGDQEPVLLVVVRPGDEGTGPTANLLAPVVVNPSSGAALQVVLDSDEWPLRAPFAVAS
ncbi:MAG TPA: flagellar assembly protein FliW [Actinotalea sp.]|nr:flagellar assembly protein FliW [Actinotalea sp.]